MGRGREDIMGRLGGRHGDCNRLVSNVGADAS